MSEEVTLIVDRCLAGNQASFGELIERFRGRVFHLCYRMLGQREDAEDAMQETFVRVARKLHQWDSSRAFEPWLLTIAGNRCRTQLAKRRKRAIEISLEFPVYETNASQLDFEAQQLREEMDLVLNELRSDYQTAFHLFHDCGMEYNQISEHLQVPLGTVKTWVHRARRELVSRLRARGVLNEHAKAS